ncbi:MAG: hypothetical protein ACI9MR_003511 [Myxococcota bacterium]|jgi:hypothetical protein
MVAHLEVPMFRLLPNRILVPLAVLMTAGLLSTVGCDKEGGSDGPATQAGPVDPTAGPTPALKGKVRTLAVAAECMRRQGLTSDKMTVAMRTMYQSLGVDLATYGETMQALTNDAEFQKSVARGIATCPQAEGVETKAAEVQDTIKAAEADTVVTEAEPDTVVTKKAELDTVVTKKAEPDTIVTKAEPDTIVTKKAEPDTLVAPAVDSDTVKAAPDETAAKADTTTTEASADTVKEAAAGTNNGDTVLDEIEEVAAPVIPAAPNYDGLYRGSASGGGEVRVSIADGRVTSGYAILNGKRIGLKGALKGDRVILSGNGNKRKATIRGKINPVAGTLSGSWTGLFDGRKKKGTFNAKR